MAPGRNQKVDSGSGGVLSRRAARTRRLPVDDPEFPRDERQRRTVWALVVGFVALGQTPGLLPVLGILFVVAAGGAGAERTGARKPAPVAATVSSYATTSA